MTEVEVGMRLVMLAIVISEVLWVEVVMMGKGKVNWCRPRMSANVWTLERGIEAVAE